MRSKRYGAWKRSFVLLLAIALIVAISVPAALGAQTQAGPAKSATAVASELLKEATGLEHNLGYYLSHVARAMGPAASFPDASMNLVPKTSVLLYRNAVQAFLERLGVVFPASMSIQGAVEKASYLIGFAGTQTRNTNLGLVRAFGGEVYAEFSIVDAVAARLTPQQAVALAKNPHVSYVEPDFEMHALEQIVPWGIDRLLGETTQRQTTWTKSTGSGVGVAVLDTGISAHEDLVISGGVRFYVQGLFLRQDNNYNDGNGHGTHVAGTIAAVNNTVGVVGVAPAANLYAVKVLGDNGSGSISAIVAGIEWAYNRFPIIKVINMSLGSSSPSTTLENACNAAYSKGMLVVSSAGNNGTVAGTENNVGYPARYDSVVAVAASNSDNTRASFSSTGPAVELIAPGVDVLSTVPGGYATYNGTSMASPHVAGVAALVWGAKTDLTNADLRAVLQNTAVELTGLTPWQQGHGLVRGDLAVAAVTPPTTPIAVTGVSIDQSTPQSVEVGKTLQLTATVLPTNATNQNVEWSSSNTAVATVSSSGLIIGVAEGSATITVTTVDGGKTDTIAITVTGPPVVQPVIGSVAITSPATGTNYKWNAWVYITVNVKDTNTLALANADVTIEIVGVSTYTGKSDASGNFTAGYRIPNRSTTGAYTVKASATYAGSAPVHAAQITFNVTGK